jgi:hypothetical protein
MLSNGEAEEIERGRKQGISAGPILTKWVDALLADRRERVKQIEHLRRRLNQAMRYLDGLFADLQRGRHLQLPRPPCPMCRKTYVQARGLSPNGLIYVHADGKECRLEDARL